MEKLIKTNCRGAINEELCDDFEAECDKYNHTELYFARDMFRNFLDNKDMELPMKENESKSEHYVRAFKIVLRQARRAVRDKGLEIPDKDRPRDVMKVNQEIGSRPNEQETNWDKMRVPYMADQGDVATMIVREQAEVLKEALT